MGLRLVCLMRVCDMSLAAPPCLVPKLGTHPRPKAKTTSTSFCSPTAQPALAPRPYSFCACVATTSPPLHAVNARCTFTAAPIPPGALSCSLFGIASHSFLHLPRADQPPPTRRSSKSKHTNSRPRDTLQCAKHRDWHAFTTAADRYLAGNKQRPTRNRYTYPGFVGKTESILKHTTTQLTHPTHLFRIVAAI